MNGTIQSQPHPAYRILEVLGQGGYGRVYHARMEGPHRFTKDVAIKLLTQRDPPPEVLQRFRDESRILGLVRDRALVAVDPPVQIGGRWAVIMEYVDGVDLATLRRAHGPLPPRVVLGIVEELARAMAHVHDHPGPDGTPLRLVHRDLKPSNVRLTAAGEVKILDFGSAHARWDAREAHTGGGLQGTRGYIAPERFKGIDGPEGDVFSLGRMLRALVHRPGSAGTTPELLRVRRLYEEMTAVDRRKRPSMREVEARARLLQQSMGGAALGEWVAARLPADSVHPRDELSGQVFAATLDQPRAPDRRSAGGLLVLVGLTGANLVVLLSMVSGTALVAALGLWFAARPALPVQPIEPPLTPLTLGPVAIEQPVEEPVVEPPPETLARVAPHRGPPTPSAAVASHPMRPVSVGSRSMGARVFLDGVPVGPTPVVGLSVAEGAHELTIIGSDGVISSRAIEIGPGQPARYVWSGEDRWEARY